MQKESSKSITFLAIVGVLFIIIIALIFQQGQALNKQLAGGISFSEYEEKGGGSQAPIKLAEQAKKMILASCLSNAYDSFENLWNEECEKEGLEERCDLPKWVADELNSEYQQLKDECYKKYPIE